MNITSGEGLALATPIRILAPRIEVFRPTEIRVTALPGILEEGIIDMTDLDPIIPKENIQAASVLGIQPLECRPAIEDEGVTITLDRKDIPVTESISTPVPYVSTSQPPPLEVSVPTKLSVATSINPELDYIF